MISGSSALDGQRLPLGRALDAVVGHVMGISPWHPDDDDTLPAPRRRTRADRCDGYPSLRRDDEVKGSGSGAMPISVLARPGVFSKYEAEFDRVLASTAPDAVVSIEGEVTVHR